MTDTLFKETEEVTFDQNKNYLEDLVGEGKKFKDYEALAKGKVHSDQTIEILTKKLDDLREDYLKLREENTATAKLEDLLDRIERTKSAIDSKDTLDAYDDKPGLKLEDIESLFSSKLTEYEQKKKEAENFNMVQNKLKERYGDNFPSHLSTQMQSLGLSKETVDHMARTTPQVLIRALGLDQKESSGDFQAPPRSARRNDSFQPTGGQKRTYSYYQELRKKDPMLYHDPKINLQMQEDAMELGEAFFDAD